MPTPWQLTQWPETLVKLYQQVEDDIIADMAERINAQNYFIPAAQWQFQKLQEMGLAQKEIYKRLSAATGKTREHLGRMMRKAGNEALRGGQARAGRADAGERTMSEGLKSILTAGMESTGGLFENLTRTTANTAAHQLENALDRAWLQVKSGAFSPREAVQTAIGDLAKTGIASIRYPSGHTDYLDTAVRRAVRTGLNQTAIKVTLAQAAELGTDLVETTAHAGARPEHANWQGKVFSISGESANYPSLRQGTGYGTGAGLGGWNCRHSINLFFEGQEPTYTREELESLNAPKYEYNGRKLTQYEAEQQQRYNERQIRRWKREYIAMEAIDGDTAESAVRLNRWQRVQKSFLEQTGFKRQYDRENVEGFGRGQAGRATETFEGRLLPKRNAAVISQTKFTEYALNFAKAPDKAIAFSSALGYDIDNADGLIENIRTNLKRFPATDKGDKGYGKQYEVRMNLMGPNGKTAKVITAWIDDKETKKMRLVSAYVDKKKGGSK